MNGNERSFYKWRPHPWHGLSPGRRPPEQVDVYVEITPFDPIKYEIDKTTGYLRADRPQVGASLPPTVYGFIPRTYCGDRVGKLSSVKHGDEDPLDVCVLTEQQVRRPEVILTARIVGGIQLIDNGKADDKIIAVMEPDAMWENTSDISDVPNIFIQRLKHYFITYKSAGPDGGRVEVKGIFNAAHARAVVSAALEDYQDLFGRREEPGT